MTTCPWCQQEVETNCSVTRDGEVMEVCTDCWSRKATYCNTCEHDHYYLDVHHNDDGTVTCDECHYQGLRGYSWVEDAGFEGAVR